MAEKQSLKKIKSLKKSFFHAFSLLWAPKTHFRIRQKNKEKRPIYFDFGNLFQVKIQLLEIENPKLTLPQ
jgi:hypothetical protein